MPAKQLRLVGYVRVSSVSGREGPRFISPKVQREQITAYARIGSHEVVDVIEDLDESGGKADRPGFQEALRRIEAGEVDGIIVARLDRFARSLVVALEAIKRIEDVGGQLISVADSFDTTTPTGRAMLKITLTFAELERDRIVENWRVARRDAIMGRGVQVAKVPVGYSRRADGRLEPDAVAAPAVRDLFLRRAAGASWDELGAYLDQALPRPNDGRWTRQTISSIIGRRTYLGEVRHGDIVNPAAHDPLVTRAEWEAAQSSSLRPPIRNGGALLAGLLRCAACGYTMTRNSDGARGYSNYECRRRHAGGICPEPSRISAGRAEPYVERAFLDRIAARTVAVDVEQPSAGLSEAVARLEAAEAELAAWDTSLITEIGREPFVAGHHERARLVDDARAALAELQRSQLADLPPRYELLNDWPTLPTAERRALLAAEVDAVFCRRSASHSRHEPVADRLRICWRGEGPSELAGRGTAAGLRPFAFD